MLLWTYVIADNLMYLACGYISLHYMDLKTNKYITYHFNHKNYDGSLMSKTIINNIEKPIDIGKIYYKRSYLFKNSDNKLYSNFVMSCAIICEKLLLLQPKKDSITIAIVIAIRNIEDMSYGNKLKLIRVTLYKHQNTLQKAHLIKNAIKLSKTSTYITDRPGIIDFLNILNCDHVINSWNALIDIKRNDGTDLHLCKTVDYNIYNQMIKESCILTIGSDKNGTFPINCVKKLIMLLT